MRMSVDAWSEWRNECIAYKMVTEEKGDRIYGEMDG